MARNAGRTTQSINANWRVSELSSTWRMVILPDACGVFYIISEMVEEPSGPQGKPRLTCIPAVQLTRKMRTSAGCQMTDAGSATICNPNVGSCLAHWGLEAC